MGRVAVDGPVASGRLTDQVACPTLPAGWIGPKVLDLHGSGLALAELYRFRHLQVLDSCGVPSVNLHDAGASSSWRGVPSKLVANVRRRGWNDLGCDAIIRLST